VKPLLHISLLTLTMLAQAGCVAVKPWQREHLARRCMTARFGEDGMAGQYAAKVIETTTGGGLPGDAPGGGCGCSQ
jgi:hypothetical protein